MDESNLMRSLGYTGVWEIFIPGMGEGEKYKFEIQTQQGERILKADPYALSSELRPARASVLANSERYKWEDQAWMDERRRRITQPYPMTAMKFI